MTLLILDYPGRRAKARLSDMGLEGHGFTCHYVLAGALPAAADTATYTARLDLPGDAEAVVALCATASLGTAIAAQLGAPGPPLPLVLVDPQASGAREIAAAYAEVLEQVTEGDPTLGANPIDVMALLGRGDVLLSAIEEDLSARARAVFLADGYDMAEAEEPIAEMLSMYQRWLTCLVAAHHHEPVAHGDVLQILSPRWPDDLSWLGVTAETTMRVDATPDQIARHPAAAAAAVDFLRSRKRTGVAP
ncbi:hypothetical protein [Pseudosporangium ferrugineum]|uniref:Uncharacterized protein n=1 Tax=Pseudosporangium ferrugineum TaxID=439699 RepID=A0A2T0RFI2_9ACTN|nr:hypothetical protein [Pseudosporangium ferrugineum]PRY19899.1 hypothetical protein CLV70_12724 [Pseudosporangium ferrugineum]